MIAALKLFAIGIALGVANVIPGVSGGTIAVVFNVYDRLIAVITLNLRKILRSWTFWLPILAGAGVGILAFSKLVSYLLSSHPAPTKTFFIGIILGSIPLIARKTKHPHAKRPPTSSLIAAAAAFAIVLSLALFKAPDAGPAGSAAIGPLTLFASGLIAAVAMIIPGISGSFILLALGAYFTIINSISALTAPFLGAGPIDLAALKAPALILSPFALGVVAGLLAGAALVRFLLKRAPLQTYGAILGLIAGSLPVIYPHNLWTDPFTILISIATLSAGFIISVRFSD